MIMEHNKKICPYCGEEILSAAKKCKYCGEWLDGRNVEKRMTSSYNSFQKSQQPTINNEPKPTINRVLFYTILVIVSLISTFNLGFESYYLALAYTYPLSTFWFLCFTAVLLVSIIISIVCIAKKKNLSEGLRLLIAIEVMCLCAPIIMIVQMNNMDNMPYNYIGYILLATIILGIVSFFMTKFLSIKQVSNIYLIWSIVYVLLTVSIFLTFKNH